MTREIIDAIASDDNLSAEAQFKSSISTKVGDALEIRRKEVANTFVKSSETQADTGDEEV